MSSRNNYLRAYAMMNITPAALLKNLVKCLECEKEESMEVDLKQLIAQNVLFFVFFYNVIRSSAFIYMF